MDLSSRSLLPAFCLAFALSADAVAQLPEQLSLDFGQADDVDLSKWLFVAPTPLGVTQADPVETLSVADGAWNWSISAANEVLVGVLGLALTDSSIETTIEYDPVPGTSIGFLNRFGASPNPADPTMPFGHGYCVLTSSVTATLIDFDFAREPTEYIRAIAQVAMPDGLFNGGPTDVLFQTTDAPSAGDPTKLVPKFDFWFGGIQLFDEIEDPIASWSSGFAGVDVWSLDPFAQATSPMMNVQFDSMTIRGVPEPSSFALASVAAIAVLVLRQIQRSHTNPRFAADAAY